MIKFDFEENENLTFMLMIVRTDFFEQKCQFQKGNHEIREHCCFSSFQS